ncbi:rho GTPase-activating protein 44 [Trichonephila inaurata madagascariensis]|uniref:Rho GTPase-activating protein 44 n=1 Tax=Trichonephila inaurata madagascariensis TaxID=2747483 RepID=A0A8X7C058_9ARAC|nr:rho GTPase-activating protein 44 [Trichonephila inaurata madagascariensis]
MKKQFLRVKQIADQTFLRAEKSDVLTEDLLSAEKRVESIKLSCQATQKKLTACQIDFGSETSAEKRLKKIPQVLLGASLLESGNSFSKNSVLGDTLRECASVQTKLGTELLDYNTEVEKVVLKPISVVLDNEVHNISKLRKQLGKLVLDMDSARTRFQTAEKHSMQASVNNNFNSVGGKVDNLKEELEDASQKVDQCRDTLATEMFSLISKEPQLAHLFVRFHQLQATYHRNALAALEANLPLLENLIQDFPQKPVYGCSLEEHLRVTNREIAQVIETCVSFLLEYGILEEGLLRVAGSASKLKKIKSAFDAGIELDLIEYIRDPHAVSGALKSYLRELPEPLLTNVLYEEWMNAAKLTDFESKLQALWQVLHKLPMANFKNLRYVVKFLSKVLENVDINKMSSQNIAIVMAPNLIWSPNEDTTTLGMNMSTASLHTSIVDLLISYCDWFFPEELDGSSTPQMSSIYPNLSSEVEVNGNTLQINGIDPCPSSPRSPHKNVKKPTAPLPPAPKMTEGGIGELIDLSDINSTVKEEPSRSLDEKESAITIELRRKSNENSEAVSFRPEKPAIPDKPSYSSCSLDRKSIRQSVNNPRLPRANNNRATDPMTRSHIERPSVPPPERPIKASKFSSSENLSAVIEPNKSPKDGSGDTSSSCQLSDESNSSVPISVGLQHSRSSSKVNRFDFLVNQKEEKPPERPPRCTPTEPPETKLESLQAATGSSPRSMDIEKPKPPRPQPPVPAKPKSLIQNENTNL